MKWLSPFFNLGTPYFVTITDLLTIHGISTYAWLGFFFSKELQPEEDRILHFQDTMNYPCRERPSGTTQHPQHYAGLPRGLSRTKYTMADTLSLIV